jgi:alginate O-acetyltransferase complex protein AlgI
MARQLFNIMIVWMLTGLWHGASWNFVLWGVYYGVLLMFEKLFLLKGLSRAPAWLGHLYSMFLVVIGWMFFAQTDFGQMGRYLSAMFGVGAAGVIDSDFWYFLSCNAVLLVALIICSIDHRTWLQKVVRGSGPRLWPAAKIVVMIAALFVSFAFLVGDSYNPFLYFRF